MSKKEFDPIDIGLFVIATASAFMLVGIATFQLFDVNFGDPMFSIAGYDLSTAWILGYGAIVGTIVTNDNTELSSLRNDVENLDQYYMVAAAATLILPIAWIVFPPVEEFFTSEDLWGLIFVTVVAVGQAALGWML